MMSQACKNDSPLISARPARDLDLPDLSRAFKSPSGGTSYATSRLKRSTFCLRRLMMKRALVAAVLVLAVALMTGTAVWAADMQGTVKTIQVNERVMTLSDGTQFYWTDSITISQDIKEGTMVKATYEPKDGRFVLTKIEVIQ